jgi:hypothetical protein
VFLPINRIVFTILAVLLGVYLAVSAWCVSMIPVFMDPDHAFEAYLALIGSTFMLCFLVVLYILWLMKYHYFYSLRKLLQRLTARSREYQLEVDGIALLINGGPASWTITVDPDDSDETIVYLVTPRAFSSRYKNSAEKRGVVRAAYADAQPQMRALLRSLRLSPSA